MEQIGGLNWCSVLQLLPEKPGRTEGGEMVSEEVGADFFADDSLKVPDHRAVFGHPSRHDNRGLGERFIKKGVGNIIGQPLAEAVANGLQSISLLLSMDQVGFGKYGTTGCNVWYG